MRKGPRRHDTWFRVICIWNLRQNGGNLRVHAFKERFLRFQLLFPDFYHLSDKIKWAKKLKTKNGQNMSSGPFSHDTVHLLKSSKISSKQWLLVHTGTKKMAFTHVCLLSKRNNPLSRVALLNVIRLYFQLSIYLLIYLFPNVSWDTKTPFVVGPQRKRSWKLIRKRMRDPKTRSKHLIQKDHKRWFLNRNVDSKTILDLFYGKTGLSILRSNILERGRSSSHTKHT